MKIILSRTDNLGDVILSLPIAGYLKSIFSEVEIYFIGKTYTKDLILSSIFIDHFIDRQEILEQPKLLKNIDADYIFFIYPDKELAKIAYQSKISHRVGTSHRWFHWLYLNDLVNFSRKNSEKHEAILNFELLSPLKKVQLQNQELLPYFGLQASLPLIEKVSPYFSKKKSIILHPKSKGSAREWSLNNFYNLAKLISPNEYDIFITGVRSEGEQIKLENPEFLNLPHVRDVTGYFSLAELIAFISQADALVAASTGTLHLAAVLGKLTVGIFPPIRPMHPQRWSPIGEKTHILVAQKNCEVCRKTQDCFCMREISPQDVADILHKNLAK